MERQKSRSYVPAYEKVPTMQAYKCVHCNCIYSANINRDILTGRLPLLLSCSHSVCENCLYHMLRTEKNVHCKLCSVSVDLDESSADEMNRFDKMFPIDRYILGSLLNQSISVHERHSNTLQDRVVGGSGGSEKKLLVKCQPAGATLMQSLVKKAKHEVRKVCCQKDCKQTANVRCINCNEFYCGKCDQLVHNMVQFLRNHVRHSLDAGDPMHFTVSCHVHEDKVAEFSCIDCGEMYCSKCLIKEHVGHKVNSIEDKNIEDMDSFKDVLQKAKYAYKVMESTQRDIKLELSHCRQHSKPSSTEYEIMKHFSNLHSRLQLLEQHMLEKFHTAQLSKANTLRSYSKSLDDSVKHLYSLISIGNSLIRNNRFDNVFISELNKAISNALDTPCKLVANKDSSSNIEFITDDDIIITLEKHCDVLSENNEAYELLPISDFSNVQSLEDTSFTQMQSDTETDYSRKSSISSTSSLAINSKKSSRPVSVSPALSNIVPVKVAAEPDHILLTAGTIENVCVTHLKDPSLLFVQLVQRRRDLEHLADKCKLHASLTSVPASVNLNDIYVVAYITKNFTRWCRARVIGKVENDDEENDLYDVFYIDYGNTAEVPLSKIREMKPVLMKYPPFAYRCRLSGIISLRNEWSNDVLEYMIKFITGDRVPLLATGEISSFLMSENSNTVLQMLVVENHKEILDIDLISNSESLSWALVFIGYAQNVNSSTLNMRNTSSSTRKIMPSISIYKKDETYNVYVSHIESPSNMYIQLFENKGLLRNMETAIANGSKKKKHLIYNPKIGMFCAAKLPSNKHLCRVKIVDVPGDGIVEVFAVDYGCRKKISWDKLCKLKDDFYETDAQAVNVMLNDITPAQELGECWTQEAISFLNSNVIGKQLKMCVNGTQEQCLLITLFEIKKEVDICINALLVKKEYADTSNASFQIVEYHKIQPKEEEYDDVITKFEPVVEQFLTNLKATDSSETEECTDSDIMEKAHYEPVEIIQIESPDCFYATSKDWANEKRKLKKKLDRFYSDILPPNKDWTVDSLCVVRSLKDEHFYRGVVTKVLGDVNDDDRTYEVFMADVVKTEIVPGSSLFELDSTLRGRALAFKCCLGGICPAGDKKEWSGLAIQYIQDWLRKHDRLYLTRAKGRIIDKTIPVTLIAIREMNQGPLEPTKIKTISLTNNLLTKGLALPDKEYVGFKFNSFEKLHIDNSIVTISDEEVEETKTIQEWLPPSHIVKKKFVAYPTYVDFNGHVYFHTDETRKKVKDVQRVMNNYFLKSSPDQNPVWEIGQMCTAKYHLDKKFYRAIVTDTPSIHCTKVQFIDFGNEEECEPHELRTETHLTDVPAMVYKCQLENLVPKTKDRKWPEIVLDAFHALVVEKVVEIHIKSVDVEPPSALIFLDGQNIIDEIMNWDWTKPILVTSKSLPGDDNESVIVEGIIDNEEDNIKLQEQLASPVRYKHCQIPDNITSFDAVVINVLDYKTIIIEPDFISDTLQSSEQEFKELECSLNELGPEQAPISEPYEGQLCIALFEKDNQWYRGEIYSIYNDNDNMIIIQVLFVDYGNLDQVPVENIRIIKPEWASFPVQMLKSKIHGIEKASDVNAVTASSKIAKDMIDNHYICIVVNLKPDLEIKFVNPDTYELAYRDAIDESIIVSID